MARYPKIDLHKKKSDVLVVHCSDPRFQTAYREVINSLGQYYDLLVFPGASKAIVDNGSVLESIRLLYSLHHFKTVHILDHVECGAFGKVDDEIKAHRRNLQAATEILEKTIPGVKVLPHLLGQKQELSVES